MSAKTEVFICRRPQSTPTFRQGNPLTREIRSVFCRTTHAQAQSPLTRSGAPCFAGTRVPIHDLFDYLAEGEPLESFLESFPSVSPEQARRVLLLAESRLFDGLPAK